MQRLYDALQCFNGVMQRLYDVLQCFHVALQRLYGALQRLYDGIVKYNINRSFDFLVRL